MPHAPRPSHAAPAYTAHVTPFDLQHPTLRRVRLSERQVDALRGLAAVPIVIDGTSRVTPCRQGEVALEAAASGALDREVRVDLYRWSHGGELLILCGDGLVKVANVELTPARTEVAAA